MVKFIPDICFFSRTNIFVIVISLALAHGNLFAQKNIKVYESTNGVDLREYAEILIDKDRKYPNDLLCGSFSGVAFEKYDKKLLDPACGNYWIRLSIHNKSESEKDWIIGLGSTNEYITFYEQKEDKLIELVKSGASVSSDKKKLKYGKDNIAELGISPGTTRLLYLHFDNRTDFSKQMFGYIMEYFKIYSKSVFDQAYLLNRILNSLFYGAIIIMFLYNLLIAISLHSRDYYSYIIFMFFFFLFNLFSDGYASETFLSAFPNHDRQLRILEMPLMFLSYIYFSAVFLKVKQYVPKFIPGLYILAILLLACYLPLLFDKWWFSRNVMIVCLLIGILYVFSLSIISYRRGYKPAIYFTVANTLLMISGILYSMSLTMMLKNQFLASTVDIQLQISSVLEISIFSLGLANRIKTAEKEKQEATDETLKVLKENQRIISEQNIILEENVKYRTEELNATNEELNQTLELIAAEKLKSDRLLLNILPEPIANELKEKGSATPQYYDMVTVIFADFVNFTQYAETHTPYQITKELDTFFLFFDQICTAHNLEKIKTIGDCYMAAGGLPLSNTTHAHDVVNAALEILEYVKKSDWQIRIGIHTGPVVAGVIGINKFAYDVWGDAVNIAARMEQASEANRVNISKQTFEFVKSDFTCTYRGKVDAKNKGKIDMYFIGK